MNPEDAGLVKLVSSNGATVELWPVGYQFTDLHSAGGANAGGATGSYAGWDANWLVIRGDIHTSGGEAWTFTDPCLTTWEAEKLSLWLRAAASDDEAAELDPAVFTEPNMSFFFDSRRDGRVRMRLRLSHESLPQWLPREAAGWQAGEYYVALEVSCADLAEAAQAWDRDRLSFAAR